MENLSRQILDEIVRRLADALHPARIYLFGSHVAGRPDADSDVDLLVVTDGADAPIPELERRGHLSLWGVRTPVDLVVCTAAEFESGRRIPCSLLHTIAEKGRLVYAGGEPTGVRLAAKGR